MGSKKLANKRAPKVKRPISPSSHEPSTLPPGTEDASKSTHRHARAVKRVHFQDDDDEAILVGRDHINIETAPAQSRAAAVKAKATHVRIAANEIAHDSEGVDALDYDTSDLYASDTPSIQSTKTTKAKTVMAKAPTRKSHPIIYPI